MYNTYIYTQYTNVCTHNFCKIRFSAAFYIIRSIDTTICSSTEVIISYQNQKDTVHLSIGD